MSEEFEKIHSQEVKKPEEEVKIEIPKEEWEILEIIAKRVGGDFGMKVEQGPPYLKEINPLTGQEEKIPYVAFENVAERSITFNPLFVKENPRKAKRIAAHEGSHRAITRGEHEIGLSKEQVKKLSSSEYIGFHSFRNIGLEDPRVNNWDTRKFPALIELNKELYDEQLKEENAQFIAPEVNLIISKLGRYPRYAEAASELVRLWHKGVYSKNLKPEIHKFLQRVQKDAIEYQNNIPPTDRSLEEKEVIEIAQKCFKQYHDYIWPEVKKLVEMDLHTEEQRQMMKEFRQKQKEIEQKREELKQARDQGDQKREEELQKEIEGLEKELDPFNGLPEDVRKELQEQIDKAIREAIERLNQEIEEKEKQIEGARQRQEELEKEIKELEEKTEKASGKEKEELEKQLQEKKAEKLSQEMKQKQAEEELKNIQDSLEQIESGEEMPYPEDKLSDKTKQELDKLFKKLPRKKQEELKEKAQETLEDFEDAVNKAMEGKLNEDKPESHKERREREEKEKKAEEEREKTEKERKELEKKLEQMRKEKMTEYDKTYEEVADIINSLYIRLKRFFLPERHPKWKKGYPTGSRVDLEMAMQAEADKRYLGKIWERKTIPHKFDYRFSILVDLSGSMKGEKIEETFKGLVVLAEVLEKLGIQYEIIGFSDSVKTFKRWKEKLNKKVRDRLAAMKSWGGGGTNTTEATNETYKSFLKNLGKDNFLITLTDGKPDDSKSLKKVLNKITKEKKVRLFGIGLGPDTEFVKDFYKAAFSLPKIKVTEEERRQGKKDFAEALAELLEDMIKHPGKY